MRLDSLSYKCLWRLKRLFGIQAAPHPVIWKKNATHNLHPPTDLWPELDEQETKNLQSFQREVDIFAKISSYVPQEFTGKQWNEIVKSNTLAERFQVMKFAKQVEGRKRRDERLKDERIANRVIKETKPFDPNEVYDLYRFVGKCIDNYERDQDNMRMIQAFNLKDRPTIAIDCRFLPDHTKRGRNLTFSQLKFLLSKNKKRLEPWPIVFVNLDEKDETVQRGINEHLNFYNADTSYFGEFTDKSYTDLFERDRLIYLSPHTDEVLTAEDVMDERNVFIIGGIVDRIVEPDIHPQASMICAQVDGIRCRSLPLDEHMTWKAGKRFLTLTSVIQILQSVRDTQGNWSKAIEEAVPVRNKMTLAEKNQNAKVIHDQKRIYINGLLRIVQECTQA
ncbi:TRNA (guanine-N1-)-methyltransferase domain containing protein [Aphelenchoides bicaudatus]|nr:TRNA (guanine-N1-)-methyltransferase domain containing protein [Aphelenchoides bicaudatus]